MFYVCYSIVSASIPLIQGAFVVGGPCQVLEHSPCRGPSAFPPCQGVAVVAAAACLRLQWVSVLICSYPAERTGEGLAGCLYYIIIQGIERISTKLKAKEKVEIRKKGGDQLALSL